MIPLVIISILFSFFHLLQDKDWTIGDTLKVRVETFERTMPLIQDLKNEAMRERHWEQLKDETQQMFDQTSDTFTLEKIMDLSLEQYSEVIGNISNAASKELIIEQVCTLRVWYMYEVEICAAYVYMLEQCLPESLDKVLLCIIMLSKCILSLEYANTQCKE